MATVPSATAPGQDDLISGNHPSQTIAVGPASRRWARIVAAAVRLRADIRTIDAWAQAIGSSRGTIKCWCADAGVNAKDSLAFTRLLRAVVHHSDRDWNPFDVLDVVDRRTLRRMLDRAGLDSVNRRMPNVGCFLEHQQFITAPSLIAALRENIAEAGTPKQ